MSIIERAEEELPHDSRLSESERRVKKTCCAVLGIVFILMEVHDAETNGHCRRVGAYASEIALHLGVSENQIEEIRQGGLLHDIGKIRLPDSILQKADILTPEEWGLVRHHPETGYKVMARLDAMREVAEMVRYHHERFDGYGYPDGLSGENIPLGARILSVADAFDAMTSLRPYRLPCSFQDACIEIARCSGTQFDPHIVEAFLTIPPTRLQAIHR